MKLLSRFDNAQRQPDSRSPMRLMCAGNEKEIEAVRKRLFEAGIVSETRRHPIAQSLGVGGLELWVQNERDFFQASRLYTSLQQKPAGMPTLPAMSIAAPKPPASNPKAESPAHPVNAPAPHVEPAKTPTTVPPPRLELKEASSLLQKGIEEILVRESELSGECTALHGKVDELTRALAQAQADAAREIKNREAAAREQAEQITGLVDTLARERREWQEKLKSSDDGLRNAKEQVGSLSLQLQSQQAAVTAIRQDFAALQLQREEQERSLAEARKETIAEREARAAAEERAAFAEASLQTQWTERQELERQVQAHAASLGSLLARLNSKAGAGGR